MRRGYDVMGVAMVDQPFASALASLSAALKGPRGQTAFFANAATLNLASTDPDYRQALNAASFMYGDGTGVRWAARARGTRLQANLNGTDLIPELIRMNRGVRVYLLGGDQDLAVAAARRFPKLFPEAVLAGWHNGYFDKESCGSVLDEINAAKPDLVLVGFGNPLQEKWVHAYAQHLDAPLTAAVGGLFAYWAGTLQRAPKLYRRTGFEWLHIMLMQPRKVGRYLVGNPVFLFRMVRWMRSDRLSRAIRDASEHMHGLLATFGALAFL